MKTMYDTVAWIAHSSDNVSALPEFFMESKYPSYYNTTNDMIYC